MPNETHTVPAVPGFTIVSLLGMGGMSAVFKAVQTSLNRVVALKFMHRHLMHDVMNTQRFQQEAKLTSLLDHPNIARVFSFGIVDDVQPYIVMEYCEAEPLSVRLERHGSLTWQQARPFFEDMAKALAHAHEAGVIHRDLKPSNVFLVKQKDGSEIAKVLDFGIAKVVSASEPSSQRLTRTGVALGSPHYMSPEQCVGDSVDARSDIYSLGCVIFEALTGKPPFEGTTPLEVATNHLHAEPPMLADAAGRPFSDDLEHLVRRMMRKDRSERFQQANEVLEAIRNADPDGTTTCVRVKRARGSERIGADLSRLLNRFVAALVAFFADDGNARIASNADWPVFMSAYYAHVVHIAQLDHKDELAELNGDKQDSLLQQVPLLRKDFIDGIVDRAEIAMKHGKRVRTLQLLDEADSTAAKLADPAQRQARLRDALFVRARDYFNWARNEAKTDPRAAEVDFRHAADCSKELIEGCRQRLAELEKNIDGAGTIAELYPLITQYSETEKQPPAVPKDESASAQ